MEELPGKKSLPKKSAEVKAERETRTVVAKLAGVSHDTISKAKLVQQHDVARPAAVGPAKIDENLQHNGRGIDHAMLKLPRRYARTSI